MTELPALPDVCWPVDPSCCQEAWDEYDEDVQLRAVALAGSAMRMLTGYQVGGCPVTVRPCKEGCGGARTYAAYPVAGQASAGLAGSTAPWYPALMAGRWINVSCCGRSGCSCTHLCKVALPPPVGPIESVMVDGATIDPSDYAIIGHDLVWVGEGDCPFPVCQDMTAADDEEGAFAVTYLNGYSVSGLGAFAAGRLACEFAKACLGGDCALPTGVTTIVRQGVTIVREASAFPGGLTGLKDVDSYLARWNPYALKTPSLVWSPDVHRATVRRSP